MTGLTKHGGNLYSIQLCYGIITIFGMDVKNVLFRCLQIFRSYRILPPPQDFSPWPMSFGNKNELIGITRDKCLLFQNRD